MIKIALSLSMLFVSPLVFSYTPPKQNLLVKLPESDVVNFVDNTLIPALNSKKYATLLPLVNPGNPSTGAFNAFIVVEYIREDKSRGILPGARYGWKFYSYKNFSDFWNATLLGTAFGFRRIGNPIDKYTIFLSGQWWQVDLEFQQFMPQEGYVYSKATVELRAVDQPIQVWSMTINPFMKF